MPTGGDWARQSVRAAPEACDQACLSRLRSERAVIDTHQLPRAARWRRSRCALVSVEQLQEESPVDSAGQLRS